jgi:carbonic anhydrase
MKKTFGNQLRIGIVALGAGALFACASSASRETKHGLLGDPTKFESLASGALESSTPAPAAVETAPAVAGSGPVLTLHDASPKFEADTLRSPAATLTKDETTSTPDGAFATLVRGNERFVTGAVRGERRDVERRRALANAHHPHTIILSCSDSRVAPELIFDQGLGDLTTIRVSGNVLGSAQVATIENAVVGLGAKLIVIMGHESCDAVKTALGHSGAGLKISAGSADLDWLVSAIRPNLSPRGLASVGGTDTDPKLRKPVMANIDAVTEQLLVRSKILSDAMAKGSVKVVRGIYGLDTGRVDFWGYR